MNWMLDGLVLVVILIFVAVGAKRGFIKAIAHFFGTVISAVLAGVFGGMVAKWVYEWLFYDSLVEKLTASIQGMAGTDVGTVITGFFSSMPDFVVRALGLGGVSQESLLSQLTATGNQLAIQLADALSPIFIGFLKILAVILLFVLFITLIRVLANFLTVLVSLPLLSQTNALLGGAFGLALGLVTVWIGCSLFQVLLPFLTDEMRQQAESGILSSVLVKFFASFNPLQFMFQ